MKYSSAIHRRAIKPNEKTKWSNIGKPVKIGKILGSNDFQLFSMRWSDLCKQLTHQCREGLVRLNAARDHARKRMMQNEISSSPKRLRYFPF